MKPHTKFDLSPLFRYMLLFFRTFVRSLFLDANSYPNKTKCFLHILLLYDTRTAFQFTLFYFNRRSRYARRADSARDLFTLGARLNKQQCPPNIAIERYTASILIQVNAMQCIHQQRSAIKTSSKSYTTLINWSIKLHKKNRSADDSIAICVEEKKRSKHRLQFRCILMYWSRCSWQLKRLCAASNNIMIKNRRLKLVAVKLGYDSSDVV